MSNLEDEIGIEETALLLSREVFPDAGTLAKCIPSPYLRYDASVCALRISTVGVQKALKEENKAYFDAHPEVTGPQRSPHALSLARPVKYLSRRRCIC